MAVPNEDMKSLFSLLEQMAKDQAEIRRDINGINTMAHISEHYLETLKNGYETVRSDVTRIQHDVELLQTNGQNLMEHVDILRGSVANLENNVMHELKLLSENLPNAVARHETLKTLETQVENLDHRIFALEQKASNA